MEHKILNWLEHIWPLMSGIAITIMAVFRLWWYDKKVVKKRIATLEALADNMATQSDLRDCRDSVDKQDAENLKVVLLEIKGVRNDIRQDTASNNNQHQAIRKDMAKSNENILLEMSRLHSK